MNVMPDSAARCSKAAPKKINDRTPSKYESNRSECVRNNIYEWSCRALFDLKVLSFDGKHFEKIGAAFNKQITWQFQRKIFTLAQLASEMGREGGPALPPPICLLCYDAVLVKTDQLSHLSRFHFEDIIHLKDDGHMILYFRLKKNGYGKHLKRWIS